MMICESPHDLSWWSDPDYGNDGRLIAQEEMPNLREMTPGERYRYWQRLDSGLSFGEWLKARWV